MVSAPHSHCHHNVYRCMVTLLTSFYSIFHFITHPHHNYYYYCYCYHGRRNSRAYHGTSGYKSIHVRAFYYWKDRYVDKKKMLIFCLHGFMRNLRRIENRILLGKRFNRWKKHTELHALSLLTVTHKRIRIHICERRAIWGILYRVFTAWKKRRFRVYTNQVVKSLILVRARCDRRHLYRAWQRWLCHSYADQLLSAHLKKSNLIRRVLLAWR